MNIKKGKRNHLFINIFILKNIIIYYNNIGKEKDRNNESKYRNSKA